RPGNFLQSRL
nr:Chain E, p1-p6 peptide [HIV-1 M:B_ARV2/SF2]4QJ8_F Chain F, p1-p6 peptide [HIV-1 M:B_ARV2/SF2]4QJA_P Chain P, p1-p6 peptide [HIV-1 M:B_ARV2/SF2]